MGETVTRGGFIVVPPGSGKAVRRRFGERTVIKATAAETSGAYALRENAVPPGFAAVPSHIHHAAEEAFYVLEGTMTVTTPERTLEATTGSFVLIPRGVVHSIANPGSTPLRWLTLFSPGWVSGWIEAESDLLQESGPDEPDAARQAAIYEQYGLEIVGSPPARSAVDQQSPDRS